MLITLDIGLRNTGWCIIDKNQIIDCGCIQTKKSHDKKVSSVKDTINAIEYIVKELELVIRKYDIKILMAELPHGGAKSASAIKSMAMATAIVVTVATLLNLKCYWVKPSDVKKIAVGKSSGSKDDIMSFVLSLYPSCKMFPMKRDGSVIKGQFEHIADSICVYHSIKDKLDC